MHKDLLPLAFTNSRPSYLIHHRARTSSDNSGAGFDCLSSCPSLMMAGIILKMVMVDIEVSSTAGTICSKEILAKKEQVDFLVSRCHCPSCRDPYEFILKPNDVFGGLCCA